MNELYVFAVMSVSGDPPNSGKMQTVRGDYTFMPFGGDLIFTLDDEIWKAAGCKTQITLYPSDEEIKSVIERSIDSSMTVIVGLVAKEKMCIPGRGYTDLKQLDLSDKYQSIDAGYDVADYFGLSAISNIGYSKHEINKISNCNISINKYGLINNIEHGLEFTKFADEHSKEHAPFHPIKIKIIQKL